MSLHGSHLPTTTPRSRLLQVFTRRNKCIHQWLDYCIWINSGGCTPGVGGWGMWAKDIVLCSKAQKVLDLHHAIAWDTSVTLLRDTPQSKITVIPRGYPAWGQGRVAKSLAAFKRKGAALEEDRSKKLRQSCSKNTSKGKRDAQSLWEGEAPGFSRQRQGTSGKCSQKICYEHGSNVAEQKMDKLRSFYACFTKWSQGRLKIIF